MQLTYRGQAYTTNNNAATVNSQSIFTYRGQSYQHHSSTIVVTPLAQLVYRGVPYIATESPTFGNLTAIFA